MLNGMTPVEFALSSMMIFNDSRATGAVHTPFKLTREMVDQIPTNILKNQKSRFLDPCCGNGTIILALIERLREYHTPKQISKMIVGCDISSGCVSTARIAIGSKYDIQLICANSLEYNWNMKFDVVVMNPPYNEGTSSSSSANDHRHAGKMLHTVFIDKFRQHCDIMAVVCPVQKWFLGSSKTKTNILDHITYIDMLSVDRAEKVFSARTGAVGIIITDNTKPSSASEMYYNHEYVGTEKITQDTVFGSNKKSQELLNKLKGDSITCILRSEIGKGPVRGMVQNAVTPNGKYQCVETIGGGGQPLIIHKCNKKVIDTTSELYRTAKRQYALEKNINDYRVGFNQAGAPGKVSMKLIPAGVITSYAVGTFAFNSKKEAQNFLDYCNTKFVRYIISVTHTSKNNSKQTFRSVPAIDLTRSWTDAELYKHFKLTKDEIALIESTVK